MTFLTIRRPSRRAISSAGRPFGKFNETAPIQWSTNGLWDMSHFSKLDLDPGRLWRIYEPQSQHAVGKIKTRGFEHSSRNSDFRRRRTRPNPDDRTRPGDAVHLEFEP